VRAIVNGWRYRYQTIIRIQ